MNYEKDLEFIRYYIKNVLIDLEPMIMSLSEEVVPINSPCLVGKPIESSSIYAMINDKGEGIIVVNKYNKNEIYEIFIKHTNIMEYDEFCRILKIGWDEIFHWYFNCLILNNQYDTRYRDNKYFEEIYKNIYKKYITEHRKYLKRQKRRHRRNRIKLNSIKII